MLACCVFLGLLMSGCVSQPQVELHHEKVTTLLDGDVLFGETIEPASTENVLEVSPAMREFIEPLKQAAHSDYARFRGLMRALVDRDYFRDTYDANGTYSAAQTFAVRRGNCLGYTNMFIALARELELTAHYQLVVNQPQWNVNGGYLVRNNHINVLMPNMRSPGYGPEDVVIDFNNVMQDLDKAVPRKVSDEYALALFHANIGVELMYQGQEREAFAHFKRGALLAPENSVIWNNMGVLYSRSGQPEFAQYAYEQALAINRNDRSAWVGMAVVLRAQGRHQEADVYDQRVERYLTRNPFYHYALAVEALESQDFSQALVLIESAIDLRRRDPRFFELQATAAAELGDMELSERSRRMAERYAQ